MVETLFLVPGIVLLGAFAFALRRSVRVARLVSLVHNLPVTPVQELQPGLRLAHGRVAADQTIKSPFHQRDCVYHAYRIEEPLPDGGLKRLATGKNWAEFGLADATGRIRIEARTALIQAPHKTSTELGHLEGLNEAQRAFLSEAGIEARHLRRFQTLRVTEYTLEPDDEVHVLGAVELRADEKVFYRGRHSPLAVSQNRDAGLLPGLRNERMLFGIVAAVFLAFALLFLVAALA